MASVMTGTAILAPPITNGLFALAISETAPLTLPGAPFFLGSVLCLAALWLASRQFSDKRVTTDSSSAPEVAAQAPAL
jgi:DHA1 family tetracycline resistance protein-like MFS transporter